MPQASFSGSVFGFFTFLFPTLVAADDLLVAVSPQDLRTAEMFFSRVNEHAAMEGIGERLIAAPTDDIPELPKTSAYLVELGYSFVFSAQISDLIGAENDVAFAHTALLAEPMAFASFEEQRAVEASVLGDIAEVELGTVDLIAVSNWTTSPSVVLARGIYAEALDLRGQRVVVNSPGALAAIEELGAIPLQIPIGEIFQSVETGFADAFVTSPEIAAATLADWQEGSVVTGLELPQGYLLAEVEAWLNLREETRQALRTAAVDVANAESARQVEVERASVIAWEKHGGSVAAYKDFAEDKANRNNLRQAWEARFGRQGASAIDLLRDVLTEREASAEDLNKVTPIAIPKADPIAFITNRVDEGGSDLAKRFGARRDARAGLTCGLLVPIENRVRHFGQPYDGSMVSVIESEAQGAEDCVTMLDRWLGANGELVIFYPGFNNTFDAAVRRAVAYKLDVANDFHMLVWSWPSMGDFGGYVHDARSVTFSRRDIKPFAQMLLSAGLGPRTTVLAHSMGSMVALNFVEFVDSHIGSLDSLYLVAPDVPRSLFDAFMLDYGTTVPGIVVYANGADRALLISQGVNRERPIGLGGPGRYLANGVEMIDVTDLATSMIPWRTNHSHAFDIPAVALDMAKAIKWGATAIDRGLIEIDDVDGKFYQIAE
ncbi:MAG: alpha/beta hydrolase [Rhodobacterales bacterium]